jgi:hypothetical protein
LYGGSGGSGACPILIKCLELKKKSPEYLFFDKKNSTCVKKMVENFGN